MTFGEKLFKLRKEKGFSQETLAEQIGTTRQAVSKWENNQGFPETEKLLQISDIFEISLDFLAFASISPIIKFNLFLRIMIILYKEILSLSSNKFKKYLV